MLITMDSSSQTAQRTPGSDAERRRSTEGKSNSKQFNKRICVEPRSSALNMTLPAFAAERRRP